MYKDKDVKKKKVKEKKDKEKKINVVDLQEASSYLPQPLNKTLEEAVEQHPKGIIGCGG